LQLAEVVKSRIEADPQMTQLPTVADLMRDHDVSRGVVLRAFKALERDGVAEPVRGGRWRVVREGEPVDRRPLEARIADIITDERLPVGAAFPSASVLAERFGVSRPTVTKALDKLEAAGALDGGFLVVRRSRHRPQYAHGCVDPCGRKAAGYCPERRRTNPELSTPKSRAGRRAVGLPEQLVDLLGVHLKAQEAEREAAGKRWEENGLVFPDEHGRSPSHRRDWAEWKALLAEAKVRNGRLHDARHTAATVLLILGVPERAVMGLMGWSSTAMAARYQHMVDAVRADIARQVDGLIWRAETDQQDDGDDGTAGVPVRAN
jgi:DNA-binding transcriptional regulator YhcF (GntR family)